MSRGKYIALKVNFLQQIQAGLCPRRSELFILHGSQEPPTVSPEDAGLQSSIRESICFLHEMKIEMQNGDLKCFLKVLNSLLILHLYICGLFFASPRGPPASTGSRLFARESKEPHTVNFQSIILK